MFETISSGGFSSASAYCSNVRLVMSNGGYIEHGGFRYTCANAGVT